MKPDVAIIAGGCSCRAFPIKSYATIIEKSEIVVYNSSGVIQTTLIAETVQKEKQRIEYMLNEYQNRLITLPKGTLSKSTCGDKVYYYLKYRDGKKIVSQYISADDYEKVQGEILERKHVEK